MSEWLHYGSALGLLSNLLSLLSLVPELSEVRPHVQSQLLNKYQLQRSGSRALGFKVTREVKRKTGSSWLLLTLQTYKFLLLLSKLSNITKLHNCVMTSSRWWQKVSLRLTAGYVRAVLSVLMRRMGNNAWPSRADEISRREAESFSFKTSQKFHWTRKHLSIHCRGSAACTAQSDALHSFRGWLELVLCILQKAPPCAWGSCHTCIFLFQIQLLTLLFGGGCHGAAC